MERNIRLNWEVIVREARKRRKERGLTQQHLAALAKVGRSTLLRFENKKGNVTLSSVLRILGVLDMLDRKQEGSLLIKRSASGEDGFTVMFSPSFGGGAMEPKLFADRESLDAFLSDLDVPQETRRRTLADLEAKGGAAIPRAALSQAELQEYWPVQFPEAR
ncbi:MAG: helix-turn-helix domain-containing protein [Candidatus Acidiferrum sp.]|jgi:transcriptional regulator with XRE-family HTH domain